MTTVTLDDLNKRVTALEKTISALLEQQPSARDGWRSTVGLFAGDDVMKEVFKVGRPDSRGGTARQR